MTSTPTPPGSAADRCRRPIAPTAPPRVELRGISKRFAATQALDDVSLDLVAGRGPRARRRERRRQEHAGQDPGRRPPARHRDDPARRRRDAHPRPGGRAGARHRGRPPGAAALPRPDRRRERLHRPRPARRASGRSTGARCGATSRATLRPARRADRSSARSSAGCRWPTSSSSRSPRRCRSTPASSSSTSRRRRCRRTRSSASSRSSGRRATAGSRCCSSAIGSRRSSTCATGRRSSATAATSSPPRPPTLTTGDLVRHMVGRAVIALPQGRGADRRRPARGQRPDPAGDLQRTSRSRVRAGEIVGMAGLVGAGRTEVARVLFGIDRPERGEILLGGKPVDVRQPVGGDARAGSPTCPEDRHQDGLVLDFSIASNVTLPILPRLFPGLFVRGSTERAIAAALRRAAPDPDDRRRPARLGPVGRQPAEGRPRASGSPPSRGSSSSTSRPAGIDIGAKVEVHRIISELAASGLGDRPHLQRPARGPRDVRPDPGACTRAVITAEIDRADATEERVMFAATGQADGGAAGDAAPAADAAGDRMTDVDRHGESRRTGPPSWIAGRRPPARAEPGRRDGRCSAPSWRSRRRSSCRSRNLTQVTVLAVDHRHRRGRRGARRHHPQRRPVGRVDDRAGRVRRRRHARQAALLRGPGGDGLRDRARARARHGQRGPRRRARASRRSWRRLGTLSDLPRLRLPRRRAASRSP